MIALDTNVLIPLLIQSASEHETTSKWFGSTSPSWCLTPINVAETLRLLSHPKVFPKPLRLPQAVDHLMDFMMVHSVITLEQQPEWLEELREITQEIPGLRGNDVFDVQIALCLKFNGVKEIATFDANFKKFDFLKVISPKSAP